MSLSFSVGQSSRFGPRTGTVSLLRTGTSISINTPALMVATSRGVVPHLGRDQYKRTSALRWISVPFESLCVSLGFAYLLAFTLILPSLENSPPIPTLQPGSNPLHTFLGFNPSQNLVAMTLRDPADPSETPANGNDYVSASTARGMKKVRSGAQ